MELLCILWCVCDAVRNLHTTGNLIFYSAALDSANIEQR